MASDFTLPALEGGNWRRAADALHAYSRVLGALRATLAPRQKHWWHASLSLNVRGLTTSPVFLDDLAIESRIDFRDGHAALLDGDGRAERWYLTGMPPAKLARLIVSRIRDWGGELTLDPDAYTGEPLAERSRGHCQDVFAALLWANGLLQAFRARQRRETSPVQLWPHHFDLALLWLSGSRLPDVDPADEEAADEQMNFGFSFGGADERPYFYATCYPAVDGFPGIELPAMARWQDEGWTGVRIDYDALRGLSDPYGGLLELLEVLRSGGEAALAGRGL